MFSQILRRVRQKALRRRERLKNRRFSNCEKRRTPLYQPDLINIRHRGDCLNDIRANITVRVDHRIGQRAARLVDHVGYVDSLRRQ